MISFEQVEKKEDPLRFFKPKDFHQLFKKSIFESLLRLHFAFF